MIPTDSNSDTTQYNRRREPTTESPPTTTHAPWQAKIHTHVCTHKK